MAGHGVSITSFNRTIVELKSAGNKVTFLCFCCFNRTIVELKYGSACNAQSRHEALIALL